MVRDQPGTCLNLWDRKPLDGLCEGHCGKLRCCVQRVTTGDMHQHNK